jgi:AcrR family transcriptional regulator
MLGNPTRDRTAERRAATRREIVDAAWAVARERGLAEITLREIAERIGMRAPSLYSHVDSKNAIYDAMFGEAWTQYGEEMARVEENLPPDLPGTLRAYADHFVGFATREPVKHLLMNQRTIPGFEPSAESYAPAVSALTSFGEHLAARGEISPEDIDLFVALVGGIADSQLANEPGGDRWTRLLPRAIDMFVRDLEDRKRA